MRRGKTKLEGKLALHRACGSVGISTLQPSAGFAGEQRHRREVLFLQIIYSPMPAESASLELDAGPGWIASAIGSSRSGVQLGAVQTVYSLSYTLVQRLWEYRRRRRCCLKEEESCRRIQETRAFQGADPEALATGRQPTGTISLKLRTLLPPISPKHSLLEHTLVHTTGVFK